MSSVTTYIASILDFPTSGQGNLITGDSLTGFNAVYYIDPNVVTQYFFAGSLYTKTNGATSLNWQNGAIHNGNLYLISGNSQTNPIYRLQLSNNIGSSTLVSTGITIPNGNATIRASCVHQGNLYIVDTSVGPGAACLSRYDINGNTLYYNILSGGTGGNTLSMVGFYGNIFMGQAGVGIKRYDIATNTITAYKTTTQLLADSAESFRGLAVHGYYLLYTLSLASTNINLGQPGVHRVKLSDGSVSTTSIYISGGSNSVRSMTMVSGNVYTIFDNNATISITSSQISGPSVPAQNATLSTPITGYTYSSPSAGNLTINVTDTQNNATEGIDHWYYLYRRDLRSSQIGTNLSGNIYAYTYLNTLPSATTNYSITISNIPNGVYNVYLAVRYFNNGSYKFYANTYSDSIKTNSQIDSMEISGNIFCFRNDNIDTITRYDISKTKYVSVAATNLSVSYSAFYYYGNIYIPKLTNNGFVPIYTFNINTSGINGANANDNPLTGISVNLYANLTSTNATYLGNTNLTCQSSMAYKNFMYIGINDGNASNSKIVRGNLLDINASDTSYSWFQISGSTMKMVAYNDVLYVYVSGGSSTGIHRININGTPTATKMNNLSTAIFGMSFVYPFLYYNEYNTGRTPKYLHMNAPTIDISGTLPGHAGTSTISALSYFNNFLYATAYNTSTIYRFFAPINVYGLPFAPRLDSANTQATGGGIATISLFDSSNSVSNEVYYWYSVGNENSYQNSGVLYSGTAASPFIYSFQVPGLSSGSNTIFVQSRNSLGSSTTLSTSVVVYTTPLPVVISSTSTDSAGNLRVNITDTTNIAANLVFYFYSTDNAVTYANSLVSKTSDAATSYSFNITQTSAGGALSAISYTLFVRGTNSAGNSTAVSQPVIVYQTPRTPTSITWDSVVKQSGNIKINITETSPPANYDLNDVYYFYYLHDGVSANQSASLASYSNSLVKLAASSTTATFTISGITTPRTTYAVYVIGVNPIGNSVIPVTGVSANVQIIPSSVSITTITAPSSGNLRVAFTNTNVANNGITYVYYAYSSGTNTSDNILTYTTGSSFGTNTFDIPGLSNLSYTIYLAAKNDVGNSTIVSSTATAYITPSSPTSVSITNPSAGNIQCTITDTTNLSTNGITYWYYVFRTGSGTNNYATPGVYTDTGNVLASGITTYQFSVGGYTTAGTYTMYILARNSVGNSSPTTSSLISVYVTPSAPTLDSGNTLSTGSGQITISLFDSVNSAANNVYYWYSINDELNYIQSSTQFTGTAPNNKYSVVVSSGLTNGTPYIIYVRAQNSVGFSSSVQTASIIPYTTPDAPTSLVAVPGNQTIDISFVAPTNNGGNAIIRYYYSTNNGVSYVSMLLPTDNKFRINTGLTNGTTYTIVVIAENARGNSSPSNSVTSTPYTIPDAPTSLVAVPGNQTIDISFVAPTNNGGNAITAYNYSIDGTNYYDIQLNTRYQITALTNGTAYTIYVRAQNAAGNSSPSNSVTTTPYTIPNAPTSLVAVPGNQLIDISFVAPSFNGGNAITRYYYSINNGVSYVSMLLPTDNKFRINTGLTNGTSYTIVVIAENAAGNSSPSNSVTTTPYTIPDAPTSLVAVPGNQLIDISFVAPAFNGGNAITAYYYSINNGVSYVSMLLPTDNKFRINTGLTNGTPYTIVVVAENAAGNSSPSNSVTTIPYTIPDAPTSLVAVPGNQLIDISFVAPLNNGGNAITRYYYSINNGVSYFSMLLPTDNKFRINTGLTNGTSYTIVVVAENAAGNSSPSGSVIATPYTIPNAPTSLVAVPGNQLIDISFVAPAFNGGNAITAYYYSINNGVSYVSMLLPTDNKFRINTGLTNGTSYTIVVIAENAAGNSSPSNSVTTIPYTIPDAPTSLVAVSGNQTIDISFVEPTNNGGNAITAYNYSIDGTNYYGIGLNTKYQITALTNGTTYTIYVRAQNAAGNSSSSTGVSATPSTTPSTPVLLQANPANYAVDISFSISSDGGNAITSYEYSLDSVSFTTMTPTPVNNKYRIANLNSGTLYTIVVRVQNIRGYSGISNSLSATPYGIPAPPAIYGKPNDTTIDISFDTPLSDGGNTITKYQYSIATLSPSSTFIDIGLPANNRFTISTISGSALVQRTKYYIQMRSVNNAGNSLVSNTLIIAPSILPTEPTITTLVPLSGGIQIIFTPPTDSGGSDVISYKYAIEPL